MKPVKNLYGYTDEMVRKDLPMMKALKIVSTYFVRGGMNVNLHFLVFVLKNS